MKRSHPDKAELERRYRAALEAVRKNPGISWDVFATKVQIAAFVPCSSGLRRNPKVFNLIAKLEQQELIRAERQHSGRVVVSCRLFPAKEEA